MSWKPSDNQVMAATLCPKFTAIASVVGSSLIIRDVILLRKSRSDGISTRHRLLAGMSVCDILSSSAWFLTSWPIPVDMPLPIKTVWSVGSRQACTAQGFFAHWAIGTVIHTHVWQCSICWSFDMGGKTNTSPSALNPGCTLWLLVLR
jgi:hypothetical protein